MAIEIPFSPLNFSTEFKPKISGVNVTLDYNNLESPLMKVSIDMQKLLGKALYAKLVDTYKTAPSDPAAPYLGALDYLQRAMLHFAIYEHLIFLIVRIGNDGVTVKKNDDETTIFKYQQDELSNTLINTAWFWAGQLIDFLQENSDDITEWNGSDAQKSINALPISSDDFQKWVGIDNSYFVAKSQWLIREVWTDNMEPRKLADEILTSLHGEISRAVVYEALNLACLRLSYSDLPENIRKDINNEYNKKSNDASDTYIREKVSHQFAEKAGRYWNALDMSIKRENIKANKATQATPPVYLQNNTEHDGFYFPGS